MPIKDGRLLTEQDVQALKSKDSEEFLRFAKTLRGQYALIIRRPERTFAITDPLGSYPVYVRQGRVSASAKKLCPSAGLSKEALFSYAALGKNVTGGSHYAGIDRVPSGSVLCAPDCDSVYIKRYFRMEELLGENEVNRDEAHDRFLGLTGSYLQAILAGQEQAACLFSSGIDSALIAALLMKYNPSVALKAYSVDYSRLFALRYSEYSQALINSEILGLQLTKITCRAQDFYGAIMGLTADGPDIPPSDRAMPIQFLSLLKGGDERPGIYFTGFNADRPYCGHAHWLEMARKYSRAYNPDALDLPVTQKAAMLCYPSEVRVGAMENLIQCAGYSVDEYRAWVTSYKSDSIEHVKAFGDIDFLRLIMILSEEEIGDLWASEHLLLERHFGIHFVSPFADLEIVKLGFQLPLNMHFEDGGTKYFLRDLLREQTGLNLQKRAFPSPMRFWAMRPSNMLMLGKGAMRRCYQNTWVRNIAGAGRNYAVTHDALVLALWMEQQGCRPVS